MKSLVSENLDEQIGMILQRRKVVFRHALFPLRKILDAKILQIGTPMNFGEDEPKNGVLFGQAFLENRFARIFELFDVILLGEHQHRRGEESKFDVIRQFSAVEEFEHDFERLRVGVFDLDLVGRGFAHARGEKRLEVRGADSQNPFVSGDDVIADLESHVRIFLVAKLLFEIVGERFDADSFQFG